MNQSSEHSSVESLGDSRGFFEGDSQSKYIMNIAIDGTPAFGERAIKRYALNLPEFLSAIDSENEYCIFYIAYQKELQQKIRRIQKHNFKNSICKIPGRIILPLWDKFNYPFIEHFTGKIDIFHCTDFDVPASRNAAIVFTLHGVVYLEAPEWFSHAFVEESKHRLNIALQKSKYFISVSQLTKEKFLDYSKIQDERVRVINLGISDEFYQVKSTQDARGYLKTKYKIDRPYILYVGAIEKRKNVDAVLDAFKILKEEIKIEHALVLVGQEGFGSNEFMRKIKDYGLEHHVYFTGNISQDTEDLLFLYNCADVFAFLSFVEGFTSPPLEAMKCGCPVVTSNASSLPETVGDAALKVNPLRPDEIAAAMAKLLTDSETAKNFVHKGLEWASQFTWERTARETLVFYRHVYENMH